MHLMTETSRAMVLGCLALAALVVAPAARGDDLVCAATSSRTRVRFAGSGPVEFGPGFSGTLGSSQLGLSYNLLLQGTYDWVMPGELTVRWPPAIRVGAVGDPNQGRLSVQYGLRLQTSVNILGNTIALPLTDWVGMADRFERGQSMFTPWAWNGEGTAVRITASERLLRQDSVPNVPLAGTLYYRMYGRYNLTTTIRTREIAFPQASSSITAMNAEAEVDPRTNGDLNLLASWRGALRYVGSFNLRVQVRCQNTVTVPVIGIVVCDPNTWRDVEGEVPFAQATEQQFSNDQNTLVMLPGVEAMPSFEVDFGQVRLGLQGRQVITLRNPGRLTAGVTPEAPSDTQFQAATDPLCITGGASRTLSVRFTPNSVGRFETMMTLRATTPGVAAVQLRLVGEGVDTTTPLRDAGARDAGVATDGPPTSDPPLDGGVPWEPPPEGEDAGVLTEAPDSGCSCSTPGTAPARSGAFGLVALAFARLARRRRPRAR